MPAHESVSCPYHFEHVKALSGLQTNDVDQDKSISKLWERADDLTSKTRGLEVTVPSLQKSIEDVAKRVELHNDEGEGYRQMTRQSVKDIENLQSRAEKFAKRSEVDKAMEGKADLSDLKSLRFWIRIWGVGTILAIFMLVVNLLFVIIPLAWPQKDVKPPAASAPANPGTHP